MHSDQLLNHGGLILSPSYRKLIRDMAPIMDPEEDFLTILAAEEQIATTETKRRKELEDLHNSLKGTVYLYHDSSYATLSSTQLSPNRSNLRAVLRPDRSPSHQQTHTQLQ